MADRRAVIRRLFIALVIVAAVVALYVASFALIRWTTPRFLLDRHGDPVRAYAVVFYPLRWLTADRPHFLPWWRSSITVRGTFPSDSPSQPPPFADLRVVRVDKHSYTMETSPTTRVSLPDRPYTLRLSTTLWSNGGFRDTFMCRIESIEP